MKLLDKLFKKKKITKEGSYLKYELIYANDAISLAYTNQEKEMTREEKVQFIEDNIGLVDTLFMETSNIIMLFEFSVDYMPEALELTSAGIIPAKFVQGGYEEEIKEGDEIKTILIPKYYLLIGGTIDSYINLFKYIPNLSNHFMEGIKLILYKNIHKCFFRELIFDGILIEGEFNPEPPIFTNYSITQSEAEQRYVQVIAYDPIALILDRLPDVFTGEDLVYFAKMNIIINKDSPDHSIIGPYLYIAIVNTIFLTDTDPVVDALIQIIEREGLFDSVFHNCDMQKLQQLTMPVYRRALNLEDSIFGSIPASEVDELFKEQYDKFDGVLSDNEDVIYKEVDETVDDSIKSDEEEKEE